MPSTVTPLLTRITDAESLTNWSALGGGAAGLVLETDFFIQGAACISKNITGVGTLKGQWFDNGSGIDFTTGRRHLYIWVFNGTPSLCNTRQAGGVRIRLGTTATDFADYYVDGSDSQLIGGWKRYVIDPTKAPSAIGGGGLTVSSIRFFGALLLVTGAAKGNNLGVDAIDYGTGLQILGDSDTQDGWRDIVNFDMGSGTNRWGIIQERAGSYSVLGELIFGASGSAASCDFRSRDGIVTFENPVYATGTAVISCVNLALLGVRGISNPTGSLYWEDGIKVGSGTAAVGRNASLIQAAGTGLAVAFDFGDPAVETVNLYGTTLRKLVGSVRFGYQPTDEFVGVTVDQCGIVNPLGSFLRNSIFSGGQDSAYDGSALLWGTGIQIGDCRFLANTHEVENPHGIKHTYSGSVIYDNLTFAGNDFDIDYTAPTGTLTVGAVNGSDPTTYESRFAGTVSIENQKTHTLTDIQQSSEVTYVRVSDDVVLFHEESVGVSGETAYAYNYIGDVDVTILVFHTGYKPVAISTTLTATDTTLPVQQIADPVYVNP